MSQKLTLTEAVNSEEWNYAQKIGKLCATFFRIMRCSHVNFTFYDHGAGFS